MPGKMMEKGGPTRPADEMTMKPSRETSMGKPMAMAKMSMGMEKGAPMRPSDPTMASKPVMSGDGLGKMMGNMGGSRRKRMMSGMPEDRMNGNY